MRRPSGRKDPRKTGHPQPAYKITTAGAVLVIIAVAAVLAFWLLL